ncbi:MAG: hypothetical protein HQM08_11510 [Candidatus Riflebacteria bacterium]|nr:hypothetical protein [Candidatus Riflebacteria bacterium]
MQLEKKRMRSFLFLDASTCEVGGMACHNGKLKEFLWKTKHDFAARIPEMFDQMLSKVDAKFEEIDLLAVGTGPGSLTGLRVAACFCRTICQVSGKPLLGISLFEWAIATLCAQGELPPYRLSIPYIRDTLFSIVIPVDSFSHLHGPVFDKSILHEKLEIINKKFECKEIKHFGIKYSDEGIARLNLDYKPLEAYINSLALDCSRSSLFSVLPLYVAPSIAEINLGIKGNI